LRYINFALLVRWIASGFWIWTDRASALKRLHEAFNVGDWHSRICLLNAADALDLTRRFDRAVTGQRR